MFRASVDLSDVIEKQAYFREINYFIAKNAHSRLKKEEICLFLCCYYSFSTHSIRARASSRLSPS